MISRDNNIAFKLRINHFEHGSDPKIKPGVVFHHSGAYYIGNCN